MSARTYLKRKEIQVFDGESRKKYPVYWLVNDEIRKFHGFMNLFNTWLGEVLHPLYNLHFTKDFFIVLVESVSINNQNYFSSQKRPFKRKQQQQQTYIPYWDMGFCIKHIKKHTFFGKGPSIATCDTVGRNPAALAYKTQGKNRWSGTVLVPPAGFLPSTVQGVVYPVIPGRISIHISGQFLKNP